MDDGVGTLLTGETEGARKMPIVCDILGCRVSDSKPPGPEWDKSGQSVGGHPEPPISQAIQGILLLGARAG